MSDEMIKCKKQRIVELTSDIVLAEQMDLPEYAEMCEHVQTNILEELMELSEQTDFCSV